MQARAREIRSSYFYLPIIFKFLCVPEFIESIFKRVDRGCRNNIFRQTIPYICNSIAKRVFSEVIMATTINYTYPLLCEIPMKSLLVNFKMYSTKFCRAYQP